MPREVFVAGQVLTAAELNVVSDQSVMVFAGTAARGSAIPSPTEGMVTYLSDADELQVYTTDWGTVGQSAILQVVSTAKTDTFSTSSNTFGDVTGLSVTITPSSSSSKILIFADLYSGTDANAGVNFRLVRNSTDIYIGDAAGSRTRVTKSNYADGLSDLNAPVQFLDSPATTSSVTYKIQMRSSNNGTVVYLNRGTTDSDSAGFSRGVSGITVMEVAG